MNYLLFLLISLFISGANAFPQCNQIFDDIETEITRWVDTIFAPLFIPDYLSKFASANGYLSWKDLTVAENIIKSISALFQEPRMQGSERYIREVISQKAEQYFVSDTFQRFQDTMRSPKLLNPAYGPTINHYVDLLRKLTRYDPLKHIREPLLPLPIDHRRAKKNILAALAIQQKIESNFAKLFSHTGFATFEQYVKELKELAEKDPVLKEIVSHFENDDIRIGIHRPEGARFWVPLAGLQNQRVVQKSIGGFDIPKMDRVEADLTRTPLDEYVALDPDLKPQYGEMVPGSKWDIAYGRGVFTFGYGNDVWVLKEELKLRTSWTQKDSWASHSDYQSDANNYNGAFFPYSKRLLAVPYALSTIRSGKGLTPGEFDMPPDFINLLKLGGGGSFFEAQVWGPVTIHDIAEFHFSGTDPSPEFEKTLKDHEIAIFKLVDYKPVPWARP